MKLSPTWRRVWRRFSFQALGWALAFLGWWQSDAAPDLKAFIGTAGAFVVLAVLLVAGLIGSVIDQPKTRNSSTPKGQP